MRAAVALTAAAVVVHLGAATAPAALRAWPQAQTVLDDSGGRLAAGALHTCQVSEDGTVRCWGANSSGQIGDGTTTDRPTPVTVLTNVVAIAAGTFHTCALLADGTVRCWGDNHDGQLGVGDLFDRRAPAPVGGLANAVGIAAGAFHSCALLADGSARCWGSSQVGQVGDGSQGFGLVRLTPVPVSGLANAVAIASAASHTCAVLADGTARCWGFDGRGQLGNGGTGQTEPAPVPVSGLDDAVGIAAGSDHTCAVRANGSAVCWGDNRGGQLGDGSTTARFSPGSNVSGLSRAVAVEAGALHTCALRADGTARCWGSNVDGKLGDGTVSDHHSAEPVSGLANAAAVAAGTSHTCATLVDGNGLCWGDNSRGQLGNGTTSDSLIPTAVAGGGGSVSGRDIAAGGSHTCAVRANATASCWGDNGSGQLGDGTTTTRLVPVAVGGLSNTVAIVAGAVHTCSLRADGTVSCWGRNDDGQLGDGTTTTRLGPAPVDLSADAIAVAAGGAHTCAILATGAAHCWGRNGDGQLGDGSRTGRRSPVDTDERSAIAIAAGTSHTCLLRVDGSVRCWGDNSRGQLGDGTTTDRLSPTPVVNLANAVAIAAGELHTCALLADGAARCWGANDSGQVGDGTTTQRTVPFTPIGLTNAIGIAAGSAHTCAVVAAGTASCWGDNSRGQLGDGTTTQRLSPTPVTIRFFVRTFQGGMFVTAPLANVLQVATGRRHTCAVSANGSVRCWGENTSGQLGNDSTIDQLRPFSVPSFTLNIDPLVHIRSNGRVATVQIIANCETGQRLHVEMTLTQGGVSGRGVGTGECSGGVARYPVTVPAHGPDPFHAGAAEVEANAVARDSGLIVDEQQWTRRVEIADAP